MNTTVAPQHDLIAIGCFASRVQRSVREIESAAERLGIKPAWKFNGVPWLDGEQVEKLTQELRKKL